MNTYVFTVSEPTGEYFYCLDDRSLIGAIEKFQYEYPQVEENQIVNIEVVQ